MYDIVKHSKTLELDKILSLLANETTMDSAAEAALAIVPSNDFNIVNKLLKETEEAYLLTAKFSAPSFAKLSSVTSILAIADAGGNLSIKDLLSVEEVLRVIRSVKCWRDNCSSDNSISLDEYFSVLYPNKYLEDKIRFCIKSEEELNDNASATLADLRRKIKSTSANIRSRFDKMLHDSNKNKFLQENIVTQRDGRFVLPVKAEHKGEFSGIVHDTSSSGATLFIEPMVIVELNNELRVLQTKERIEIEKILSELSNEVSTFSDAIRSSYNVLVKLNLIFAKASLAYKMRASVPNINTQGKVYLKNARHPLIDKNKIVPITVSLGDEYSSLIITGPNTGGKTVTLKTTGLLTLMTMCGMMIPVDDNSSVAIFDRILADIGDEQSIEQSLSTFSSHMVNIIDIINNANENSLVLLDELGGGTDPIEGASLARAILSHLHKVGVKTVATTHYAELKSYALDTDGVENACFEFDVKSLKPTYRLFVGIPGKSNAFEIAASLGMDDDIINQAKNGLSEENMRFDRIAEELEKARIDTENERNEATKLRLALAEEKKKIDSHLAEIEKKKELIIARSREEAARILDKARFETNQLLNSIEDIKKEINSQNAAESVSAAKSVAKKGIDNIENIVDPVDERNNDDYALPRLPVIGDVVLITSLNKKADITRVDEKNKRVYVSSGNINMWVSFEDIRLTNGKSDNNISKTIKVSGLQKRNERSISGEIDIRGLNIEEGVMEVDRYIDSAILAGIETITVIHGKGTGVLRNGIHSHLRKHKNVDTFRIGTFGEGENGVTIVTLKN